MAPWVSAARPRDAWLKTGRACSLPTSRAAAASNVDTIRAAGGTAEALHVDVGTQDGVRGMVERAVELWGRLDIVVNNAYAGTLRGDAVAVSEEDWDRGMDVGLKAMFRSAKYAVPHMRQVGGGSMVNLSSVHGLLVAPGWLVYETLKTAVIGLTRQMAAEYGPDGIRVNAVCPGHIVTERNQPMWDEHPDGLRFFEQQYPVRRTGKPIDIANAIAFLCSAEASFITARRSPSMAGCRCSCRRTWACTSATTCSSTLRPGCPRGYCHARVRTGPRSSQTGATVGRSERPGWRAQRGARRRRRTRHPRARVPHRTGLAFDVLVDRAMDIGPAEHAGRSFGWRSATGFRHPGCTSIATRMGSPGCAHSRVWW